MKYLSMLVLIGFLLFSSNSAAEFYKYVDANGDTRFTDDINQVPQAQRSKIRSYIESQSEELADPPDQNVTPENQKAAEPLVNLLDESDESDEESLKAAKKRIDEIKQEMDKEYEALMKEKEQLAEERQQAETKAHIAEYNKKVDNMNKRVAVYEQKGKDYKAQVEKYNARIAELNAKGEIQ